MSSMESKLRDTLRMNLVPYSCRGPEGLHHFLSAQGIFTFSHIHTLASCFAYSQKPLNEASKNTMLSANT